MPNRQTLKFGLRHTDSIFGEIMPSRVIGPLFSTPDNLNKIAEWPRAWVKQRSYNIDYSWKPEGNRWIDFDASLWTTRTKSKTNTAGGSPGDAMYEDRTDVVEQLPNTNGRFNTIEGNAYYANNTRNGFNFSNRMKLHDKLTLTLMGDFQNEKLRSRNEFSEELSHDGLDKYREEIEASQLATNTELTRFGEPRSGRRREWNFGFNFRYQPMSWLTLTAGARYTNFKIQDDNERLKTRFDKYNNPLEVNRGQVFRFMAGLLRPTKPCQWLQPSSGHRYYALAACRRMGRLFALQNRQEPDCRACGQQPDQPLLPRPDEPLLYACTG